MEKESAANALRKVALAKIAEASGYNNIFRRLQDMANLGHLSCVVDLPFDGEARGYALKKLNDEGFSVKVTEPEDRPCGRGWVAEISWRSHA